LSCVHSKLRSISTGAIAAAIGISLTMAAMAQESPRRRTPRNLSTGLNQDPRSPFAGTTTAGNPNTAQGPGGVPLGPGPGCNVFPASANIGTAVPLSYFGPPPSSVNQSLVGPVQLLNTGQIDSKAGTITIPLYLGHMKNGKNVWYILTDVDDASVAAELGLNFSAKMTFMANAARTANFDFNNDLVFDAGTVDFSPVRNIVPGPTGSEFPPSLLNRVLLATQPIVLLFRS
jgi:hypothetical protein